LPPRQNQKKWEQRREGVVVKKKTKVESQNR